jgi:hypothetical protein
MCCAYGPGYYRVTSNGVILAEGGQFADEESTDIKSYDEFTGIADTVFQGIEIFPNPAHDRFTLVNAEGLQLNMYDMTGRSVLHRTLNSQDETIRVNNLSPGTYFIQLSNGVTTHTQKFIIK